MPKSGGIGRVALNLLNRHIKSPGAAADREWYGEVGAETENMGLTFRPCRLTQSPVEVLSPAPGRSLRHHHGGNLGASG